MIRALLTNIWLLACLTSARADPFLPLYSPHLGSIDENGSLYWQLPIAQIQEKGEQSIPVYLVHSLSFRAYEGFRSDILITPFRTSLWRDVSGRWEWLRPGGGTRIFKMGREVFPTTQFAAGDTQLTIQPGGDEMSIAETGWVLTYSNGTLHKILSPRGAEYQVRSSGEMINSIVFGSKELVHADWTPQGRLSQVSVGGKIIKLNYDGDKLRTIDRSGETLVSFHYTEGYLDELMIGEHRSTILWHKAKIESAAIGLHERPVLSAVDCTQYSYERENGIVRIRKEVRGKEEILTLTYRYGQLWDIYLSD